MSFPAGDPLQESHLKHNTTVLSQVTDDTCLTTSINLDSSRGEDQSPSRGSSLQSLEANSFDRLSRSSGPSIGDDGIRYENDPVDVWRNQSMVEISQSDSGLVVSFTGCLPTSAPRELGKMVM